MFRKLMAALLSAAVAVSLVLPAQGAALEIAAPSAVLMDAATGTVLYEKNAHAPLAPASVTKIMTLLLVMEALDSGRISWDDTVTASEAAAAKGGSQVYLEPGEQMSMEEMISLSRVVKSVPTMEETPRGTETASGSFTMLRCIRLSCSSDFGKTYRNTRKVEKSAKTTAYRIGNDHSCSVAHQQDNSPYYQKGDHGLSHTIDDIEAQRVFKDKNRTVRNWQTVQGHRGSSSTMCSTGHRCGITRPKPYFHPVTEIPQNQVGNSNDPQTFPQDGPSAVFLFGEMIVQPVGQPQKQDWRYCMVGQHGLAVDGNLPF